MEQRWSLKTKAALRRSHSINEGITPNSLNNNKINAFNYSVVKLLRVELPRHKHPASFELVLALISLSAPFGISVK